MLKNLGVYMAFRSKDIKTSTIKILCIVYFLALLSLEVTNTWLEARVFRIGEDLIHSKVILYSCLKFAAFLLTLSLVIISFVSAHELRQIL